MANYYVPGCRYQQLLKPTLLSKNRTLQKTENLRSFTDSWILMPSLMEMALKSLKSLVLTLILVLFSFFPTWLLLGNTTSQLAIADPALSASVGTIPGEFSVNGNGGATYTIAIEVPPGIKGVQPNLAVVYDSQQGNGLLGVGWQLAGFSAIARCNQTIASDGHRGGVNFDDDDRFCLNGQRLMAVSGNYGADGTEYHTERETWVKVISHGSQNGPQSFTATTKDGQQMEFGVTDDSRILARGRSDEAVRVWALNKITDRHGNFVEINYQNDEIEAQRSLSGAFLGYYPTEIRYTGNTGVMPLRLVAFEYEERNDNIAVYVGGSKAETTKRLQSIKTYVDLDGDGSDLGNSSNLVKDYQLSYGYSPITGQSHLTHLEECDPAGVCLPATVFSYENEGELAFGQWPEDFNCTEEWCSDPDNYLRTISDVNGDGLADIVGFGNDGVEVVLSTGEAFEGNARLWIGDFGYGQGWRVDEDPRMMADVNGDGLQDVVGFGNDGVDVALSTGESFGEKLLWINDFGYGQGWLVDEDPRMMADVNGDGLQDVVGFGNNGVYVALSTGESFVKEGEQPWIGDFGYDQGWDDSDNLRGMSDVNGDGLQDVVGFDNDGVYVALSTGDSFEGMQRWINDFGSDIRGWGDPDDLQLMADVSGDGLADVVGFDQDKVRVATSQSGNELLTRIVDGLHGQTQIEYQPLTDKNIYTKGSEATYPEVDIQAPIYVVSEHVIAESETDPTNTFVYQHRYATAKADHQRSWLGFERTILEDKQNHTQTTTSYHTDFPLLGLVAGREIEDLTAGETLGKISSDYGFSEKDGNGIYKFWQDSITLEHYTTGNLDYTLQRTYGYDEDYQNAILVSDLGDVDDLDDDVYTCIAYAEGTGDDWWHQFFPSHQKTSSVEDCGNFDAWNEGTDLRWEEFDYDDQMNLTCQRHWLDQNGLDSMVGATKEYSTPRKVLPWWKFGWIRAFFQGRNGTQCSSGETEAKWLDTEMDYDAYGNLITLTDTLGNTSHITYDSTYQTFPEEYAAPAINGDSPLTVQTLYEPKFGIKTKTIDVNDNTAMEIAESAIDGFGRVLEVQGIKPDSSDLVTLGKAELLEAEKGLSIKTWYRTQWEGSDEPDATWLWQQDYIDGLGRTYKSEGQGYDGKTIASELEFNSVGEVEKEFLPYYLEEVGDVEKAFFSYEYNIRGNVTQTTSPLGAISLADYDGLGDGRQITYSFPDPSEDEQGSELIEALVENTTRGWLKQKTASDDSQAFYTYDRLGQVVTITDPLGQTTEIVYNSLGKIISETTQETGTTQYFYNDNGKLTRRIDAEGQQISLEYDALGRVIQKEVYESQNDSTPTETITYEYDDPSIENGKGALTKIIMPTATYSFAYNNRGQLQEEKVALDTDGDSSREEYLSQYTYDAAGRPDEVVYPDGAIVHYTYHDSGELYTVELKDTGEGEFETYATYEDYNALGELSRVSYNNQVESNYTYDEIGRILTSTTTKDIDTYFDFSYNWNKANKLLAITDNAGQELNQSFGYNSVGRMIEARGDRYPDLTYEYDEAGNITQRNSTSYDYKTDKRHQLQDGTYDANGNTISYGPWTYTYDAQNRLLQVDRDDSDDPVNQFTYDDSGNRLNKIEPDGTVTYYVAPFYEVVRDAEGSLVHTKYIAGPQGTIAAISKDGSNVSLIAAIQSNSINLEAELYNPHSWGGLAQILSAKLNQLTFSHGAGQILATGLLVAWLLSALAIWLYHFCRSAPQESWTGKVRTMVTQISLKMGWITPKTADRWLAPQAQGWLLQTRHRPASFALALVAFSSVSLSGPSLVAELSPGENGEGYPVAGKVLYFHYDQLGSTSLVTDSDANIVSQVNYEPYGALADSSGEDTFRPKFTGKEYDSNSELYYFGARYYNADLGRFLTPDPAQQYFSPYVYGNGDPLSGTDPNGEDFGLTILIIAIGATAGAYMGGTVVNDTYNPASWDWDSGKTWAGIVGGGVIGGATAGAAIAGNAAIAAAGAAAAAAGISTTAITAATVAAEMTLTGGLMATMNASFTAMAGGDFGNVAAAFGIGFGAGALFATPGIGYAFQGAIIGYDTFLTITDPSVEGGVQLGTDLLFLGLDAGMRLKKGSQDSDTSRSCSASFVAGTEVATAQGEKPIEEIAVGDTVLAYNEETGEEGEYPVTHLFTRIAPESIVVTVGGEEIVTTPEHEFYTANGWIEAEDLQIGDTLVQLGGKTATLSDLEPHQDSTRVYNFEVDEVHTYYVSGKELLVHNPCNKQEAQRLEEQYNIRHPTPGKKRAIAIADLNGKEQVYSVSGNQVYPDAVHVSNIDDLQYRTDTVGHPRALDAEVHIIEYFEKHISRQEEGYLILYVTENHVCNSCKGVIKTFSQRHPNIGIDVYTGYQTTYYGSMKGGGRLRKDIERYGPMQSNNAQNIPGLH